MPGLIVPLFQARNGSNLAAARNCAQLYQTRAFINHYTLFYAVPVGVSCITASRDDPMGALLGAAMAENYSWVTGMAIVNGIDGKNDTHGWYELHS